MKIIDLTEELYDNMPVYPGDPEVKINKVLTLAQDGWNMNSISLPSHIATHANVPIHAFANGKNLDDFPLTAFFGEAVVFQSLTSVKKGVGLIFDKAAISSKVIERIIHVKPKFVGVAGYFETESELATEKLLLKIDIISFEGLANVNKLPKGKTFMFYGVPLRIRQGDGSPVRAFAVIN